MLVSPAVPCMNAGQICMHAATVGYCCWFWFVQFASIRSQYAWQVAAPPLLVLELVALVDVEVDVDTLVEVLTDVLPLTEVDVDVVSPPPLPESSPQPAATTRSPHERTPRRSPRFMTRSLGRVSRGETGAIERRAVRVRTGPARGFPARRGFLQKKKPA